MNLTQALNRPLEWRAGTVVNASFTEDVFVACPMLRSVSGTTMDSIITVANLGSSTVEMFCLFKEIDIAGNTIKSTRNGVFVAPGFIEIISFGPTTVSDPVSVFSAACNLPPRTQLLLQGN